MAGSIVVSIGSNYPGSGVHTGSLWDRFNLKIRLNILHYALPEQISIVPTQILPSFAASMPRNRRDGLRNHLHWGYFTKFSDLLLVSKLFFEDVKVAFYHRAVFEIHFYEQGVQFLDFEPISSYEGVGFDWAARLKSRFAMPYSVFDKKLIRHLKFVFWACDFDNNPLAGLRMRTHAFQTAKSFDDQVLHSLKVVFEENMEIECHCCGAMKLYWSGSLEHMCPDGTQHPGDYCSHIYPTALHETVLAMDRSTVETVSAPLERLRVCSSEFILPQFNDSGYDQGYAVHFQNTVCGQSCHNRRVDDYERITTNDWEEYKAKGPMTAPRYLDRTTILSGGATYLRDFADTDRAGQTDADVFTELGYQAGMDFSFTMESSMGDVDSSRGNDRDNIAGPLTDEWPTPEMYDDLLEIYHPHDSTNLAHTNKIEAPEGFTVKIVDGTTGTYGPSADLTMQSVSEQQLLDALFESSAHIHPISEETAQHRDLLVLGGNPNVAARSDDGHGSDLSIISANTESPELVALSDGESSVSPMDIDMASDQDEPEMFNLDEDEDLSCLVDLNDHIRRAERVQQTQANALGASGSKHMHEEASALERKDVSGDVDDWFLS